MASTELFRHRSLNVRRWHPQTSLPYFLYSDLYRSGKLVPEFPDRYRSLAICLVALSAAGTRSFPVGIRQAIKEPHQEYSRVPAKEAAERDAGSAGHPSGYHHCHPISLCSTIDMRKTCLDTLRLVGLMSFTHISVRNALVE